MRGVRPFAFLIAGILIGCAPMGPSSTSPQATTPYGFGSGGASLTVTLPARRGIQVLPTTPWDTATVTVISPHLRTNRVQAFGGGSTTLSGINGLPAGPATISVALSTASVTISSASIATTLVSGGNSVALTMEPASGIITTLAGSGSTGYTGDGGQARLAQLNAPIDMMGAPSGNVYIDDQSNNAIRRVTPAGIISTFAGGGTSTANGVPAASASLYNPEGIAVDASGDVFISDTSNRLVRMVPAVNGTFYAQTMTAGFIYTIAGGGTATNDAVLGTSSYVYLPTGIAVDATGDVFIANTYDSRVQRLDPGTGKLYTVAGYSGAPGSSGDGGLGPSARLNGPTSVAVSGQYLYIADNGNFRIRRVNLNTGIITTFVGTGTSGYTGDGGPAASASIADCKGVFCLNNYLYFADDNNDVIRRVNLSTNVVTTFAGVGTSGFSGDEGAATAARLNQPAGVGQNAFGSLLIADQANNRIRMVTP